MERRVREVAPPLALAAVERPPPLAVLDDQLAARVCAGQQHDERAEHVLLRLRVAVWTTEAALLDDLQLVQTRLDVVAAGSRGDGKAEAELAAQARHDVLMNAVEELILQVHGCSIDLAHVERRVIHCRLLAQAIRRLFSQSEQLRALEW